MARVGVFVPCYAGVLRPGETDATRRVLEALGDTVETIEGRCCGQPAFNSGFQDEARRVGREALRVAGEFETIVVPSGSCTSMIQHYLPSLWQGNRRAGAESRAKRFVAFPSYVASHPGWREVRPRLEGVVAFHDSCHGQRELGLTSTIAGVLDRIDGLEVRRLAREDECCGFGGTFSVKLPEVSRELGGWKVEDVLATGARAVVSADVSCLAHIQTQALARGEQLEAWSLSEVLARALA